MCMGGKKGGAATPTPAPAPDAPLPAPEEADIGSARKAEEADTFGTRGPSMRVDRSVAGGASGGSGVKM